MLSIRYICAMEFEISYTNQEITPWGGMVFLRQMLDKVGFKSEVENCIDLPQPGSNRGYSPVSIIEEKIRIGKTDEKYVSSMAC